MLTSGTSIGANQPAPAAWGTVLVGNRAAGTDSTMDCTRPNGRGRSGDDLTVDHREGCWWVVLSFAGSEKNQLEPEGASEVTGVTKENRDEKQRIGAAWQLGGTNVCNALLKQPGGRGVRSGLFAGELSGERSG